MKPLIAITGNFSRADIGGSAKIGLAEQNWDVLAHDYTTGVEAAGGIPVVLPLYGSVDTLTAALSRCDGVILSGGNDISPIHYGEPVDSANLSIQLERDKLEIALARHVLNEGRMPLLGICRGVQVMNVAMGGTLYQDLPPHGYDHGIWGVPLGGYAHQVTAQPDSRLADLVGTAPIWVNSYHHQAVRETAAGLVVAARAADGLIEAVEKPGAQFALGVQWHPEMLPDCPRAAAILEAFVSACVSVTR